MKKSFVLAMFLCQVVACAWAQIEVKNVIVMIPDGTSTAVLPIARWYNHGNPLNLDEYMCGMVRTHSSNAPIGDSAPTSSTYATGHLSQSGYVSTYPPKDDNDLFPHEPRPFNAYQPLFTLLEAAKLQGKSTGLVATCEFTHATPADFSAHTPTRGKMNIIAKQIVHNNVDVLFAGGQKYLYKERDDKEDLRLVLKERGVEYIEDVRQLPMLKSPKAWGLFADTDLAYDANRDETKEPSIEEMTKKAIELLSKNEDGFFLMVEGSKVDWAAHAHDTKNVVEDFLAFDRAVGAALHYARSNENTLVVVMPDHGNGGLNIISPMTSSAGYDRLPLKTMLEPLQKCLTPQQYSELAVKIAIEERALDNSFEEYCDEVNKTLTKPLSEGEKKDILPHYGKIAETAKKSLDNKLTGIEDEKGKIAGRFISILNQRSYFGWVSSGHTGEDVFFAAYHPRNERPTGVFRNRDLNQYLQKALGSKSLDELTNIYFSPLPTSALKQGDFVNIENEAYPVLTFKRGKDILYVPAYTNKLLKKKGKKTELVKELPSVVVYMKENSTFYLPESLKQELGY